MTDAKKPKGRRELTEQERKFAGEYVNNGGNATAAARSAGYKTPRNSGRELMLHPPVLELIEQLKQERGHISKGNYAEEGAGVKARRIDYIFVIERLAHFAQLPPSETKGNISGQVKATAELAKIFGRKVQKTEDGTGKNAGKNGDEVYQARWRRKPLQ